MKRFGTLLFLAVLVAGFSFSAVAATVTLTINVNGQGTTNPTPGVHSYTKNTTVVVTAYPADGWSFVNWTGSVNSTKNPLSIKMNNNKTITANFTYSGPPMYTLTTSVVGQGTVTPAGTTEYESGTIVDVSAQAAEYWQFDHWEGNLSGSTNPTTILMDGNKSVTGVFTELPNPANALANYVNKPDSNYTWSEYYSSSGFLYTDYFIDMTSQQFRYANEVDRVLWQHYLIVTKPWFSGNPCIILIDGGSNGGDPPMDQDDNIGLAAVAAGVVVADLKQIPNEPLMFADEPGVYRSEDDILAYCLDKAAVTGDFEWVAHLAMVKAGIRGMDTVHAKVSSVTQFIIAGASKRGWTTWLMSAYDDPRIIGEAHLVIDILNMDENVDHHWEAYGFYAPAVQPYADFDLFCRMKLPEGQALLRIVDPWLYLEANPVAYTKPKVLVCSTGDQFFLPDSMQFYINDIPGVNHIRYVPNTDHNIDSDSTVLPGVIAWATNVKNGAANPAYTWSFEPDGSIRVVCQTAPSSVKLWQMTNPVARDFRVEAYGANYTSSPLYDQGGGVYVGYCPPPAEGWTCFMVEMTYSGDHIYSSPMRVTPDILPFAGTHCM